MKSALLSPQIWSRVIIAAVMAILWFRYPANFASYQDGVPGDFAVYLRANERVADNQSPYIMTDPSPYKYSPGILAVARLFPDSPPSDAWFWFGTASIVALGVGLGLGSRYRSWKEIGFLVLGIALAWKGILETLDYGQLELLIFGIALLAGASARRLPFISGLLGGTLPWLKLPWLLMLVPLLLRMGPRGNRKSGSLSQFVSGYFGACFAWGAGIPALILGSDRSLLLSQEWLDLLKSQPSSLYSSPINQSLWISVLRWLELSSGPSINLGWMGVISLLMSWVLGRLVVKTVERNLPDYSSALSILSPWLLVTQLLNPLAWRWGSVFAVGMPFAATQQGKKRWIVWGLVLGFWLVQLNPVARALGYDHWTSLHPVGSVTLYWIALVLTTLI